MIIKPRPQAEIQQDWIRALQGFPVKGKTYQKQAKEALRITDPNNTPAFCCLGVLCDIIAPERWGGGAYTHLGIITHMLRCDTNPDTHDWFDKGAGCPPIDILNLVGMRTTEVDEYVTMNDNDGKSFDEIAEYALENL